MSEMRFRSREVNSRPMTEASWIASFASCSSRSMRLRITSWIVSGTRTWSRGRSSRIRAVARSQHARLYERLRHLFHVEGIAFTFARDQADNLLRQIADPQDSLGDRGAFLRR